MKRLKQVKYIMVLFIILGFSANIQAQDCLEQLKSLYQSMEKQMVDNSGNVFQLKYVMTNVLGRDYGGSTQSTSVEILSQGQKSYFLSDQASIFQDATTTYTVMPSQKEIIISPNMGESIREARLNQISSMQEHIFSIAKLKQCREIKRHGTSATEITLNLPSSEEKNTGIQKISFLVNFKTNSLLETTIFYAPGGQIASSHMSYQQVDYNATSARLKQPVSSEIFVSGEQLTTQYKDYKVINYSNQ